MMDDFTIITYSNSDNGKLLSLTESDSGYMLPAGGRFRVIDFTLRNSLFSGAAATVIYSSSDIRLSGYLSSYKEDGESAGISVETGSMSDFSRLAELIERTKSAYYVMYPGDNPSIIDFSALIKKFSSRRSKSLLFQVKSGTKKKSQCRILIAESGVLRDAIKKTENEKKTAPNMFEMLFNRMINQGMKTAECAGLYWSINSVPEYFDLNRKMIWDSEISSLLFKEKIIKSRIFLRGYSKLLPSALVKKSFIADYCEIDGTVENSIIFPGNVIKKGAYVKNSIILPFNVIGESARVVNSVLDEQYPEQMQGRPNIEPESKVGIDDELVVSAKFPLSLSRGLTLIGKGTVIPSGVKIGAGCYIFSGLGADYFLKRKHIYNGETAPKIN